MNWDEEIGALPDPVRSADVVRVLQAHNVQHLDAVQAHSLQISTVDPFEFTDALSEAEIEVVSTITAVR